jgi:diguanylate cyclase (GGDEF)-like protein
LKENALRWNNKDVKLLIIMFDIDNFKLYNDQFSHPGGDYCLKTIAEAIRKEFPAPGLDFFRYGGEEFLLFFELNDPNDAPKYVEQTRKAIKELKLEAPKGAPKDMVTISVGGLLLNNVHGFSFEEQMKLVDSYLYTAKANGKDVCVFDGSVIEKEQQ